MNLLTSLLRCWNNFWQRFRNNALSEYFSWIQSCIGCTQIWYLTFCVNQWKFERKQLAHLSSASRSFRKHSRTRCLANMRTLTSWWQRLFRRWMRYSLKNHRSVEKYKIGRISSTRYNKRNAWAISICAQCAEIYILYLFDYIVIVKSIIYPYL